MGFLDVKSKDDALPHYIPMFSEVLEKWRVYD
jgi:hypothetical protein